MTSKPFLFVGSSVENLQVGYDVQENLEHDANVKVWPQGIFEISDFGLDSLLETLKICDFAVFVFAPDDLVTIRGEEHRAVRDNVLFELGLFMGRLGRQRTFVIVPSGVPVHLPSDLVGLNLATYDPKREDTVAALGVACNKVRRAIRGRGLFRPEFPSTEVLSAATLVEARPPFQSISVTAMRQEAVDSRPAPARKQRRAKQKNSRRARRIER